MLYTDYLDNFVQRNTLNPNQIHSGNIWDAIAPWTIKMSDTNFNYFQDYIWPDWLIWVDFITDKLDAEAGYIKWEFTFTDSWAISISEDANNWLWISPNGILWKKNGNNTFTLTNEWDATFGGTLAAATGIIQNVVANNITITWGSISWANVTAPSYWDISWTKPPINADNTVDSIGDTYLTNITPTWIYTWTITGNLIQTSPYSNTGVKMWDYYDGIRVYWQTFRMYEWSTLYWYIWTYGWYYNIQTVNNRNLLITTWSGTTFLSWAAIASATSWWASCWLSSQYWSNVYSNNYTLSGWRYINTNSWKIQLNSDSRISWSLYISWQIFFEWFSRIRTTNYQWSVVDLYPYRIPTFNDSYSMYTALQPLLSWKTIFVSFR